MPTIWKQKTVIHISQHWIDDDDSKRFAVFVMCSKELKMEY